MVRYRVVAGHSDREGSRAVVIEPCTSRDGLRMGPWRLVTWASLEQVAAVVEVFDRLLPAQKAALYRASK